MPYRATQVAVFATGLSLPSHMALTAAGRVLVSEFGAGRVRDVTDGTEFRNPEFGIQAAGFGYPGGILETSDGRLLVADSGEGTVRRIDGVSTAEESEEVVAGVPHPYGLVEFEETVYTSFSDNTMVGLRAIDGAGARAEPFVFDFPVVITSEPYPALQGCGGSWGTASDDRLFLAHAALGTVFNVTGGGSFSDLRTRRHAWGLDNPLGMTVDPLDGDLYVAERGTGAIRRIGFDGGYSRFSDALVVGFREPSCVRFTPDGAQMYVCDRAWDSVYRVDLARV